MRRELIMPNNIIKFAISSKIQKHNICINALSNKISYVHFCHIYSSQIVILILKVNSHSFKDKVCSVLFG